MRTEEWEVGAGESSASSWRFLGCAVAVGQEARPPSLDLLSDSVLEAWPGLLGFHGNW